MTVVNSVDVSQVDYSTPMRLSRDCSIRVLFLLGPFGESSMVQAVQKGNIRTVMALEYSTDNYILFQRSCVDVWGS